MTDYKNLKLIASSSPHIRSKDNTRSIMLDVIIALLPALVMSIYVFGVRALTMVLVSVAACVFWEWGYRKLLKKPQSIGDLSAVVTGMLLAFVCPPTLPYWMIIIGAFFAIVVVKQLYGGIGCNFVNPALVGRAMLLASYASAMTHWVGFGSKLPLVGSTADVVTSSTPMAVMKGIFSAETAEDALAAVNDLTSTFSISDMFIGRIGGSLGETSALALLLGFVYLLLRRVINWQIPVCYIGTVAVLTLISAPAGSGIWRSAPSPARRRSATVLLMRGSWASWTTPPCRWLSWWWWSTAAAAPTWPAPSPPSCWSRHRVKKYPLPV